MAAQCYDVVGVFPTVGTRCFWRENKMALLFDDRGFYFKAMIPEADGLPKIGRSSRMLGVRVPKDIVPDEKGMVGPGNGGMSVAPNSMWNVPNHRRPRGMRMGSTGKSDDYMYSVSGTSIPVDKLSVRLDPNRPEKHAFVEPAISVDLSRYETDLASTRNDWRVEWP
jgi:hypothetical protein